MKTFLVIFALVGISLGCNFPPEFWCSSAEIAKQCKVHDQCLSSVWGAGPGAGAAAPVVGVELYYESLCPFCQQFVTQVLYPAFLKVGHVMNVTLVPFGNARETRVGDKYEFTCQHGPPECVGNLLETCAIHTLKTMDKIMPFVNCMELSDEPMSAVKSCAEKLNAPLPPILSCFNSSLGNALEHQAGVRTTAVRLRTHMTGVPWILINGVYTEAMEKEAREDLVKLVCKMYKGPEPTACQKQERTLPISATSDLL